MRSGALSRAFFAVLAAGSAIPAAAQTSDVLFGGWSWRARDPGSRPAGLGGAYVAVADSIRTAAINPAGVALIPKAELSAGTSALWAGIGISLRHTGSAAPAAPAPPPAPGRPLASPAPVTTRPTQPGRPVPCAPARQARPLALALFVEQAVTEDNQVDVVRGPGLSETGALSSTTETAGL